MPDILYLSHSAIMTEGDRKGWEDYIKGRYSIQIGFLMG